MDRRLLSHYTRELSFVRELSVEFARRFPKVAGRLGLAEHECTDPHVERLLQGFALLAGRVSMRLDAEYPAVPRGLIELVCPSLLAPVPSMTVAQFEVDPARRSLGNGYVVERDTVLRTSSSAAASHCEFRTAHAVQLLPIELEAADYTSALHELAGIRLPEKEPPRALLRLRLRAHNCTFSELSIDRLPLFIAGDDIVSAKLYEQLVAHTTRVIARWQTHERTHEHAASTTRPAVRSLGFEDEQALLPTTAPRHRGHRLLHEYFALPSRFDFVELTGLRHAMERCASDRIELLVPLTRFEPALENAIDARRLLLFATPAINLFPRACARLSLRSREQTFKIEPDRSHSQRYEIHSVSQVWAYGSDGADRELLPRSYTPGDANKDAWHYTIERRSRALEPARQNEQHSDEYVPSDLYLTLAGPATRPSGLRELAVEALCTNASLPSRMTFDRAREDFVLQSGAPAEGVRCVVKPTAARSVTVEGELAWSLLSRLSFNYLSVDEQRGAADALRELLSLYAQLSAPGLTRQAEGVRALKSASIIGPMPGPGARTFTRGLELQLQLDEQAHAGHRAFTLASVLSELFAGYASTHGFTQTVLSTEQRGLVHRFPAKTGVRPLM
jgi:type VI secretion system protein ImpG